MSTIRVLLADDHGVVRRGIREFLNDAGDTQVIAEAEDGTQALKLTQQHYPDVVVLDVRMPGENGIEVTRHLRQQMPTLGILILSAFDDPPYIHAALQAGANGYVLKSSDADEIVDAVRTVYEGKQVLDSRVLQHIAEGTASELLVTKLTDREIDVLRLAAHGMTNKAIGFQLAISDRTVQGHLANIYEKFGVASRTEAVTRAVALGFIDVPRS